MKITSFAFKYQIFYLFNLFIFISLPSVHVISVADRAEIHLSAKIIANLWCGSGNFMWMKIT